MVHFCGMDHQKSKFPLISVPFLLEAVEVSRCYFFKNWLMKLKYSNLRILEPPSSKFQLAYFYLSESINKICFNMRYPVDHFLQFFQKKVSQEEFNVGFQSWLELKAFQLGFASGLFHLSLKSKIDENKLKFDLQLKTNFCNKLDLEITKLCS